MAVKELGLSAEELSQERPDSSFGPRISIVGVGGAGNKLLGTVIGEGGAVAEQCIAVNTDRAQLSKSLAQNKVLLGEDIVSGHGAMGSVSLGRRAFQLSAHRVTSFVEASDITIILVGFGGGTGTAAAPLIAQWARTQVKPVVAVVALPFAHEREKRFIALRGLKKMSEACDCTIVIDNAVGKEGATNSEERFADTTAVGTVRSILEALSNLEQNTARNVMRVMMQGALAVACVRNLKASENLSSALIESIRTPSSNLPLSGAQGAVVLHSGPVPIREGQASQLEELVASLAGRQLNFAFGSVVSPAEPTLCALLTGFDYRSSIGGFVDLLTELYDVEYGQPPGGLSSPVQFPLYQLEGKT